MSPVAHRLRCQGCDTDFPDDGLLLACPECADGSLLTADYTSPDLPVDPAGEGVFRYRGWLPVRCGVPGSHLPVVYRSTGLAGVLGLTDLWISFAGYWPERGCRFPSATFKDLEPQVVLGRMADTPGILVVASAGNTAAAFATASGASGRPCLLVVPATGLDALASVTYDPAYTKIVATSGSYNDAISLAKRLTAEVSDFVPEGGVRNVARRAGLGVVMMAAFEHIGHLPDYYVQAVGSAAGALGCHEVARRLGSGRATPRVLLCQNREESSIDRLRRSTVEVRHPRAQEAFAPELLNAHPPYDVAGGIRDMLVESGGDVLLADARAARAASAMFEECEGIDIAPASAVATACLAEAVAAGRIPQDAEVLLNVTGGGRTRLAEQVRSEAPIIDLHVPAESVWSHHVIEEISRLAEKYPL